MRRILRFSLGRVGMTVFCLLVQLLALLGASRLCGGAAAGRIMAAISWAVVVAIVAGQSEPGYKTAWCVLVLAVPVFGVLCYLTLGGCRKNRRLRRLQTSAQAYLDTHLPEQPSVYTALLQEAPEAAAQVKAITRLCGAGVWYGGEAKWFSQGEACFYSMLSDLRNAKQSIWLEYYIIRPGVMWDSILAVLRQKAAVGVDVRVIYDDFGCLSRFPSHYPEVLRDMGIDCRICNPFVPMLSARLGSRDHRKLMLVDGSICYTGGINLSDEYIGLRQRCGHWKDAAMRLTGDGVYGCSALFLSMWTALGGDSQPPPKPKGQSAGYGYVQPFWDSPLYGRSVGRNALVGMIARAQRYVHIMTPYFVPDEALREALYLASASGVSVCILTPGMGDKWYTQALTRAHYPEFLEAGAEIYEYSPGFLHEKVCVVDDCFALVGTVNLDYRSFYLQFENGLWLYGRTAAAQIEADFQATRVQCRAITPKHCAGVSLPKRIGRAFLRLFAPLI